MADPFAHLLPVEGRLLSPEDVAAVATKHGAKGRAMQLFGVQSVLDRAEVLEREGRPWGVAGVVVKGRRTTMGKQRVVKLSLNNMAGDEVKVIVNNPGAMKEMPGEVKVGSVIIVAMPGTVRQVNPFNNEMQFCLTVAKPEEQVHVVGVMEHLGFCEMMVQEQHAKLGAPKKPCGKPIDLRATKFRAFCKTHANAVLDKEFTRLYSGGLGRMGAAETLAANQASHAEMRRNVACSALPSAEWAASAAVQEQEQGSFSFAKPKVTAALTQKAKDEQLDAFRRDERKKRKRAAMEKEPPPAPTHPALKRVLTPAQRMAFAAQEAQKEKDRRAALAKEQKRPVKTLESATSFVVPRD